MKKINCLYVYVTCVITLVVLVIGCSIKNPLNENELWPAQGRNGKWGYINSNGSFIIPPIYDDAADFSCGYAIVEQKDIVMCINTKGETRQLHQILMVKNNAFMNNYAIVQTKDAKYGIIDKDFKFVIEPSYYELGGDYGVADNGFISFRYSKDDQIGYIDVNTGEIVIAPQFDYEISGFLNNLATVEQNGKCGLINKEGVFVLSPIYEWLFPIGINRYAFLNNGVFGLISSTGDTIVEPIYSRIIYDAQGFYYPISDLISVQNELGKFGYITTEGKMQIPMQYDFAYPFAENYAVVYVKNHEAIINMVGDEVFLLDQGETSEGFFHNGLIRTYKHGYGYRYRNTKGNIVFEW